MHSTPTLNTPLIRAVFVNPQDGRERRSFRTHLKGSTNRPLCGANQRTFGCAEGIAARWIEVEGEMNCPVCERIAKRMQGGAT